MGYTVSLVAEQWFSPFHDVFWGARELFHYLHDGMKKLHTLESFDQQSETLRVFNEGGGEILVWSSTSLHV